jgi:hypothetical protein
MGAGGWKDAETFMTELEADPAYQAMIAAQDAEHERRVARNLADAAPIARELAALGFDVEAPGDLYGQGLDYRSAIPLLIRWLPLIENPDVKGDLMRALSIEWARPAAARPLVDELRRAVGMAGPEYELVCADAANALSVVADDSIVDDVLELVQDERVEVEARAMLVEALGNMTDPRAAQAVVQVLESPADAWPQSRLLLVYGLGALRRFRRPETRGVVERFLEHRDREIRAEAARALKAIDRPARRRPDAG